VWATENTRAALFDSMWKKETFGTSGPRIKVRLFGGWDYGADVMKGKDWLKTGYAKGVPMGGDLPAGKAKAPTFLVWAVKDPTSGNLDRIQIVKGWSKSGQSFERVYDVAWAGARKPDPMTGRVPAIGSTVNIERRATRMIGAVELKATWTDPSSIPARRVLLRARDRDPTPRWTTIRRRSWDRPPPSSPATVEGALVVADLYTPTSTRARPRRTPDGRRAQAAGRDAARRRRAARALSASRPGSRTT
jgi:hypothetical protein